MGNSPKFAAFRGFSGKLASPGTFIADSLAFAMVLVGWVYYLLSSSSCSLLELLVFPLWPTLYSHLYSPSA